MPCEWHINSHFIGKETEAQTLNDLLKVTVRQRQVWKSNLGTFKLLPRTSQMVLVVKKQPARTQVWSLSQEDPLEEGMETHFSVLAWRIPWTGEPSRFYRVTKSQSWLKQLRTASILMFSPSFETLSYILEVAYSSPFTYSYFHILINSFIHQLSYLLGSWAGMLVVQKWSGPHSGFSGTPVVKREVDESTSRAVPLNWNLGCVRESPRQGSVGPRGWQMGLGWGKVTEKTS